MKQSFARGYIKKSKTIKHKDSKSNRFVAYSGVLKVKDKDVIIDVYSEDENLKDEEIYVKLSVDNNVFRGI